MPPEQQSVQQPLDSCSARDSDGAAVAADIPTFFVTPETSISPTKLSPAASVKSRASTVEPSDSDSQNTAAPDEEMGPRHAQKRPSPLSPSSTKAIQATTTESESESGSRSESRRLATVIAAKSRKRPSGTGNRGMTVETETVKNLKQVPITSRDSVTSGPRARKSTDTIRAPAKPKKKRSRAANVGMNPSSKAEIFAAKVASAVDEVDNSDSETFVYESNPFRPHPHSRTSSVTSITSGPQTRGVFMPQAQTCKDLNGRTSSISGRRSMKFTQGPYTYNERHEYEAPRHKSLLADDSPFRSPRVTSKPSQASLRIPHHAAGSRTSTRPSSPRAHYQARAASLSVTGTRRSIENHMSHQWATYEDDIESGGDERVPLMISKDKHKFSRGYRYPMKNPPPASIGFAPVLVIIVITTILIFSGIGFVCAANRPLRNVEIRNVTNVLVSEREVLLDLIVSATNPNVLTITVEELDVDVFAQSSYVADPDDDDGIQPTPQDSTWHWPPKKGDPVDDSQTMLLGRVNAFESPLVFDSVVTSRNGSVSTGVIRIDRPGSGGDEGLKQWQRVRIHPFQLIVRGILKYKTPFSSKRTVPLVSSVHVDPSKKDDPPGKDGVQ
ncbi:Vacuolar segregation protein 7 [Neolecta irregularis DAH-3]|uniref:Vacuolar segregation protein 7 n=1 Tax=Neolecta irregularis (strain DAH-3) TaxID=1198029 RepID=A0A1U7LHS4_NEOID|nr:Vacuolar segregation protein 7 [Neolecta irregularis DAH-3]|eukprot:OLL22102.1 Vacuolar segregation protein 7 [Neolecta irregularis DAH-3]